MSHKPQLCQNCGAKLEIARVWQHLVVCSRCYLELSGPKEAKQAPREPAGWWPAIGVSAAVAAVVIAVYGLSIGHGPRGHAPIAGPSNATVPPPNPPEAPPAFFTAASLTNLPTTEPAPSTGPAGTQPAATAPTGGAITGTAWLFRKDDAIVPIRGLPVQLLRPTVRRQAVLSSLEAEAETWRDLADAYQDRADQTRQMQDEDDEDDSESAADYQQSADVALAALERIGVATRAAPRETDLAGVFRTLTELSLYNVPRIADVVADTFVGEARTDAEGKYVFENVPPGTYYLHAAISDGPAFVEWFLPVQIGADGTPARIDLSKQTAALIYGDKYCAPPLVPKLEAPDAGQGEAR